MDNFIVNWADGKDRWTEYNNRKPITPVSTDTVSLNEEEKDLLHHALNKTFVNPKFKMKYFVAGAQITNYHELRQLFLELRAAEESLETVEYNLKRFPKEIEQFKLQIERETDPLKKVELELGLLKVENDLKFAQRRFSQGHIERHQWLDLIKEFLASDKNKTKDGKSLMTVFDTPLEDEYEAEYWTARLAKMAALDMTAYGNITAGNLDAITQLPIPQQEQILTIAHKYNMQLVKNQELIRNELVNQSIANEKKETEKPSEVGFDKGDDLKNVYSL
jgi:hypothetical protein